MQTSSPSHPSPGLDMAVPLPTFKFDSASYLAWEAGQPDRHEFVDGEIYAMVGARDSHNRVALNVYTALRSQLRGTPCRIYVSDVKLHIVSADSYVYPDVFVTCHEADRGIGADLIKRHPSLVVEVASDSTAAYDRRRKFELYRSVPGLTDILFVEPDRVQVDLYHLHPAEGFWVLQPADRLDAVVRLQGLGVDLPLSAVYEDVLPA